MKNLGTKIIGVWDDHDYGINDGGQEFHQKHEIRKMFLDAIDEPLDTPRRIDSDSAIH
jgi:alkaline phosphatase D